MLVYIIERTIDLLNKIFDFLLGGNQGFIRLPPIFENQMVPGLLFLPAKLGLQIIKKPGPHDKTSTSKSGIYLLKIIAHRYSEISKTRFYTFANVLIDNIGKT